MTVATQMRYKAAAIQFEPAHGEKGRNLESLVDLTTQAAEQGARLIVLPELATTGYCWLDRNEISALGAEFSVIQFRSRRELRLEIGEMLEGGGHHSGADHDSPALARCIGGADVGVPERLLGHLEGLHRVVERRRSRRVRPGNEFMSR